MLRFDMRVPTDGPCSATDLYRAAIEMSEWADQRGCLSVVLSEHHASPDGYLPSPLVLASAIASRTTMVPISVSALLLLMYDPVKLAEDMAVLDLVSGGRVGYVIGMGYRDEEYAMFGVDRRRRAALMDERLAALQQALSGTPFTHEGREVQVTPPPATPGGPMLLYGGGSRAAAARAGRFGLGFIAQGPADGMEEAYHQACAEAGHEPGMVVIPDGNSPTTVFVARDVDAAWEQIGPHMLHDARMYAAWMGADTTSVSKSTAATVDELRAEEGPYRIYSVEEATAIVASGMPLGLQPLCGGCPPEHGWETLRLIVDEVLPAAAG